MALKQLTSSHISDNQTRALCNELVSLVSVSEDWDMEQALSIHHQLNVHMHDALKHNQGFYAASELEFLINLIEQLSAKIEAQKRLLAVKIAGNQKNKKAVNKYKSNV